MQSSTANQTGRWSFVMRLVPTASLVTGLVLVTLYALRPISDPDIWWHLKTGEIIVETGQIPRTDVYSHTAYDKPWVAHEWLSQVIFHLSTVPFGLNGLRALNAVAAIALLLLLWRRSRQACANPLIATAVWAACVTLCLPFMTWRPHLFSIPIVLLLLPRILFPAQARYSAGRLTLLAAGFWLWANLHSMVCLGIILLGISWVAVCLRSLVRFLSGEPAQPFERQLPLLMGIQLLAVSLAVGLTPNGFDVYWYATVGAWLIKHSPLQMVEWLPGAGVWCTVLFQRLVHGNYEHFGAVDLRTIVTGLVVTGVLWRAWQSARGLGRENIASLVVAVVCVLAAIEARRASWLLIPVLIFVVSPAGLIWTSSKGVLRGDLRLSRRRTIIVILFVACCMSSWATSATWTSLSSNIVAEEASYPVGLAEFIRDARLEANLAHPLGWGGYLIYTLHPQCRVLIHGEVPMYERWRPDIIDKYLTIEHQEHALIPTLADADVDLFIARGDRLLSRTAWPRVLAADGMLGISLPQDENQDDQWLRVFTNREGAIYLNVATPRGVANMQRCRDLYRQFGVDINAKHSIDTAAVLQASPAFAARYRLVHEGYATDLETTHDTPSVAARCRFGDTFLRLGLPEQAANHFAQALQQAPNDIELVLGAFEAAYDQRRFKRCKALAAFAQIIARDDRRVRYLARYTAPHARNHPRQSVRQFNLEARL